MSSSRSPEDSVGRPSKQARRNNTETTYQHRSFGRIAQACSNCRRKKARCSGHRPACTLCQRLSQRCIYADGDQAKAWATTPRPITDLSAVAPEVDSRTSEAEATAATLQRLEAKVSNLQSMMASMSQSLKRSGRTTREHSRGGVPVERNLEGTNQGHAASLGISSIESDGVNDHSLFHGILPWRTVSATVDAYFKHVDNHPYSFFHEETFRERLAQRSIPDHLLFAVLATAARFSDDPFYGGKPHTHAEVLANKSWNSIVSQIFTGSTSTSPDLCTVQSITLLAIFDFTAGKSRHGSAWIKIGLSVRIAQDLRLMMDPDPSQTISSAEEQKRTFWSLYHLDHFVSCGRARPPAILEASCQLQLPCEESAWRAERAVKSNTLENLANRDLHDASKHGSFATIVLACYVLSRCAQYTLQDYNIRSKDLPWDPQSDYASIASDIVYLESHFRFDRTVAEALPYIRDVAGNINYTQAKPMFYAQSLVILANVLLHHPFLMRRRLQAKNITPTVTFLTQSFETCRLHATRLSQLLYDATEAGCMMSTSSFGYAASVVGSVHAMNSHSFDGQAVQESQQQLEYCHSFLSTLANHWHNCARIRDNLSSFTMNSALFSTLADPSQLTTSLDAKATETMWTMVDYSTMSNLPEIVLPDGLYLADQPYVDQWFDLFNSMEAFDYSGFTDNTVATPIANGGHCANGQS